MIDERFVCKDCGYRPPAGRSRPATNTCPQCRGDFTWTPELHERVAQQLRPYMSDAEAATVTPAIERVIDGAS